MKKVLILLLLVLSLPAWAADFGAIIDNTTTIEATDPNNFWFQKDKVSLWLSLDIGEYSFFNIMGNYTFVLQEPYHTYGLDVFELTMDFPVIGDSSYLFGFTLGRFNASEFTGYVFSHNLDGAQLVFKNAFMNSYLTAGFTGFLFKADSSVQMSIEDRNYTTQYVEFAPPRLVGMLEFNFPELFAYQSLDVSFVGQLDMHSDTTTAQEGDLLIAVDDGGKIDSVYGSIGIGGPLFPNFYWDVFFTFETGRTVSTVLDPDNNPLTDDDYYTYVPIYAFMAGLKFNIFFPELLKSELAFSVIGTSGDADYESYIEGNYDDFSLQFTPISRPTIGLVFPQQVSNILIAQLDYSIKPFADMTGTAWENMQMILSAIGYFRTSISDVSNSEGLNNGSQDYYLGTEVDFTTNFRPFSDLGLSLAMGVFFPNNYTDVSAFTPDSKGIEFVARFTFSFEL
ncbi:MAG: hypothetical protein JW904_08480 [Spirochaetales bacterium]|nr:hypothetical protein [Spirochaetales bacterium]